MFLLDIKVLFIPKPFHEKFYMHMRFRHVIVLRVLLFDVLFGDVCVFVSQFSGFC